MNRKPFLDIVMAVQVYDPWFECKKVFFFAGECKKDCTCTIRFSMLQKCTTTLRVLTYGAPADTHDDYMRMSESTTYGCMYRFCRAIVPVFGESWPSILSMWRVVSRPIIRSNHPDRRMGAWVLANLANPFERPCHTRPGADMWASIPRGPAVSGWRYVGACPRRSAVRRAVAKRVLLLAR
jgi:hypothetical protein